MDEVIDKIPIMQQNKKNNENHMKISSQLLRNIDLNKIDRFYGISENILSNSMSN